MRVRLGLACILAIVAVQLGSANVPVQQPAGGRGEFIDRFLAPDEPPLVSYRAFRRLTASTRGGRMRAAIEAWTTLDPVHGFSFEITSMEGSALIQRKVLIAALEAEQMAASRVEPSAVCADAGQLRVPRHQPRERPPGQDGREAAAQARHAGQRGVVHRGGLGGSGSHGRGIVEAAVDLDATSARGP